MAFYNSSQNVTLEGTTIRAECRTYDGQWRETRLHLHQLCGANWEPYRWLGELFGQNADNIRLEGSVLQSRIRLPEGTYRILSADLNDRIVNDNGHLRYCDRWGGRLQYDGDDFTDGTEFDPARKRYPESEGDDRRLDAIRAMMRNAFSNQPAFQYTPLSTANSIRLLKLDAPSDNMEHVSCTLTEVNLSDAPDFAALSYTWRSPFQTNVSSSFTRRETNEHIRAAAETRQHGEKTITIKCNGHPFEVGYNLYEALRRLNAPKATELRDEHHKTELIREAGNGSLTSVEGLLREGADVAVRDRLGMTALHYAAADGHFDIVRALVYAGSDINALDHSLRTPLDYARQRHHGSWKKIEDFITTFLNHEYTNVKAKTSLRRQATDLEYFWCDAICMNQSSEEEKSSQVAIMGDIFKAARSVVVWLGPETHENLDNTTEHLLNGAWRLEAARSKDGIDEEITSKLINSPTSVLSRYETSTIRIAASDWLSTIDLHNITPQDWLFGLALFRRSWFGRAWIIQEIFMAKELTLLCGKFVLPWDTFILMSSVVEWFRLEARRGQVPGSEFLNRPFLAALSRSIISDGKQQGEIPALTLERRRRAFERKGNLSMLSALSLSRNVSCSEPADKIFSVLSFSSFEEPTPQGRRVISPDYSQSVHSLYTRVATALFEAYGPSVLSLSGLRRGSSFKGLPSWVPDHQSPLFIRPRGIDIDELSEVPLPTGTPKFDEGSLQTEMLRITHQQELFVTGIIWDTLSQVSPNGLSDFGTDLHGLETWPEILSNLSIPLQDRSRILWRTLVEDHTANFSNTAVPASGLDDRNFQDWLLFLSFISVFDLRDNILKPMTAAHLIDARIETTRTAPQIFTLLIKAANHYFPRLGITLSDKDIERMSKMAAYLSDPEIRMPLWRDLVYAAEKFGNVIRDKDPSRRLMRTRKTALLGTAPELSEAGDVVCFVEGAKVPYVLRERERGRYMIVGEAYVYGVDAGQVLAETGEGGKRREICII